MAEFDVAKALEVIKKAEEDRIRLQTQSESALQTLQDDYGINSIAEGDAWLDKYEKEYTEMKTELETMKKTLSEGFPWD